jgi:hypothetical protein
MEDMDKLVSLFRDKSERYEKLFILYKINKSLTYYFEIKYQNIDYEFYYQFLNVELKKIVKIKKNFLSLKFIFIIYDINLVKITNSGDIKQQLDLWALLRAKSLNNSLASIYLSKSILKKIIYHFPLTVLWSSKQEVEKSVFELADILYKEEEGTKNFKKIIELSYQINN